MLERLAGAPPLVEPLSHVVAAKVTDSIYFDLETRTKGAGVAVRTYLRRLVQGQPPTVALAARPRGDHPAVQGRRQPEPAG